MRRFVALTVMTLLGVGGFIRETKYQPTDPAPIVRVQQVNSPQTGDEETAEVQHTRAVDGTMWKKFSYREQSLIAFGFELGMLAVCEFTDQTMAGANFQNMFLKQQQTIDISKNTTLLYATEVPERLPLYRVMFKASDPPIMQNGGM